MSITKLRIIISALAFIMGTSASWSCATDDDQSIQDLDGESLQIPSSDPHLGVLDDDQDPLNDADVAAFDALEATECYRLTQVTRGVHPTLIKASAYFQRVAKDWNQLPRAVDSQPAFLAWAAKQCLDLTRGPAVVDVQLFTGETLDSITLTENAAITATYNESTDQGVRWYAAIDLAVNNLRAQAEQPAIEKIMTSRLFIDRFGEVSIYSESLPVALFDVPDKAGRPAFEHLLRSTYEWLVPVRVELRKDVDAQKVLNRLRFVRGYTVPSSHYVERRVMKHRPVFEIQLPMSALRGFTKRFAEVASLNPVVRQIEPPR